MAFQSIKKILPPSCPCMEDGFVDRLVEGMLRPSPRLPDGYLAFARKVAEELFCDGWDRSYIDHCYTTGPTLSAVKGFSRRDGGGCNIPQSQSEYLDQVTGLAPIAYTTVCEPMVVQSAGKPRPLTKFGVESLLLKPLHKSIYDRLSVFPWLSRGDIRSEALDRAGFRRSRGGLISGDYKSATDNLPLSVAIALLEVILSKASRVPDYIRSLARDSLEPLFHHRGKDYVASSGQQMGALLCFPLLCLQNYVAFRWALQSFRPDGFQRYLPRDVPLLINGDDILFQLDDPRFFNCWIETVGSVGLEVERTKTSVSSHFGSLNSTLLRWSGASLRVVPTVRMGMLKSVEFPNSLSTSFRLFTNGLSPAVRYRAGLTFLSWHRASLLKTALSAHELGFVGRFSWRVWCKMGLNRLPSQRYLDDESTDPLTSSLPAPPCPHNVIMSSDRVSFVPSLLADEEKLNSREMASDKWRVSRGFSIVQQSLAYWSTLSRPALPVSTFNLLSRPVHWAPARSVDYQTLKALFFRPRPKVARLVPAYLGLDRLPAYGEEEGEVGMLEQGLSFVETFGLRSDKK